MYFKKENWTIISSQELLNPSIKVISLCSGEDLKKQSNDIEKSMTIYSFRHTGALEIFKRTGSITKLQKAMGHSSIKVSLTYLRGLEVPELNEEDMPMI